MLPMGPPPPPPPPILPPPPLELATSAPSGGRRLLRVLTMKLAVQVRDRQGATLKTIDDARLFVLDKLEARPNTTRAWEARRPIASNKASTSE